jgi:colicin import membrane protein
MHIKALAGVAPGLFYDFDNNKNIIILMIIESTKRRSVMEISSEIRTRIIAAADKLFDEAAREKFPPVDQVRRLAKADMNTTSAVMKDWRRQQTAASPGVAAIEVPARIQEVFRNALAEAWQAALDMTNETLNAAQQAWESERQEAELLRGEVSEAYEVQAKEFDEVRQQLAAALDRAEAAEMLQSEQAKELLALGTAKSQLTNHVEQLTSKLDMNKGKLDATRSELALVQAKADMKVSKAVERYKEAALRLDDVLGEMEGLKRESAEAIRKANRATRDAREHAAGLAGQLEALKAHNRELMAALKSGSTGNQGG